LKGIGPQIEGKFWEAESILTIGRLENLDIVLTDPSISRRHAEAVCLDQGWVIRDLGSLNGTFLNGVRVGRANRKLRQRDVIQVGNLVMVVAMLEEELPVSVETPSNGMQVEACTQNSWEKALEVAAFDENKRPQSGDRLLTLLRAGHHLGHTASLDKLLRSILDDAVAALAAQRGSIVLADEVTGHLTLRAVSTGDREMSGRVCFSRSLAQRCFSRGESLLCRDVSGNAELSMANSIANGTMSSIVCALLRSPRKRLGVLHLDRGPFDPEFTQEDLHLADALAASVSAGIECAQLVEKQRQLFIQTVTALAHAVELRDQYTGNHTQRVTDYALVLAEELRLSPEEMDTLQIGTPLHDIGKIGIDDAILRKPGRLTGEEYEEMTRHTLKGAAILETIPALDHVIPIVRNHHERWDGGGYPDGLRGEETPRLARIVAVADAFDAMTSDRPYRPGMPLNKAFLEIHEKAGKQFDPDIADAFLRLRPRVEELIAQRAGSQCETVVPKNLLDVLKSPTDLIKQIAVS
jgi:putative nucleotidyltransferase with HDIG domain